MTRRPASGVVQTRRVSVPEVVRRKALASGAAEWLERLPALVDELAREWSFDLGQPYANGTEAFASDVTLPDGAR